MSELLKPRPRHIEPCQSRLKVGPVVEHSAQTGLRLGDGAFFKLLHRWTDKYRYRCVTTEDFIALASTYTDDSLNDFWRDWLFVAELPPYPAP